MSGADPKDWLLGIPAAWKPVRVKYLAESLQTGPFGSQLHAESYTEEGIAVINPADIKTGRIDARSAAKVSEETAKLLDRHWLEVGDVIFSRRGELGRCAVVDESVEESICGTGSLRARLNPAMCCPKFLWYFVPNTMAARWLSLESVGSTMENLNTELLGNLYVAIPPVVTQDEIATYLDRETARIDALVAEKERMLVLLEQKRAALISRAVTRGLNPKAPTKPSGLDWLGEIPAHWGLERSKRYFIERDERSETGEEEMLTVSHITGVTPRSEKDVNMFEAASNEGYKLVSPDQLVINTLWAWMGAMGVARHEGIVSPAYHVYRIAEGLLPAYVDLLVRIPAFKAEVVRFSKGVWSSRLRLYPEGLHQIWIPIPPLAEQEAIIAHIRAHQTRAAALDSALRDSIALLKERRSALITAAVTGRLDITRQS